MRVTILKIFINWLPFAVISIGTAFLVYATVQQNYRQSANDPQIQMAEDTARELSQGRDPKSFAPAGKSEVGIVHSLAPFIIIYDENGTPISSTGALHEIIPAPPKGVFEYVKKYSENRLTWQPEPDVRIASVIVKYENGEKIGYVLAGRSLREIEIREQRFFLVCLMWLGVALFATFAASAFKTLLEK